MNPLHKKNNIWLELSRFFQVDVKYFARGGFWLGLAQIVNMLVGLAISAALARYLTKAQFGEYQFIMTLIGVFLLLSLPGFNIAAYQGWVKGYHRTVLYAIKMRSLFGILGSISFIIVAMYLFFVRTHPLWWGYLIIGILFPFIAGGEPISTPIAAKENFRKLCKRQTLLTVIAGVCAIITGILSQSFIFTALAYLGSQIFINSIFFFMDYSTFSTGKIDPEARHFAIHLSIINFVSYLQTYYDKLLVTYFFGFLSIAVYSIASAIADQVYAISKMLVTLIYPRLLKLSPQEAFTAVKRKLPYLTILFAGLGLIGIILAKPFIVLIYTSQYAEAIIITQGFLVVSVIKSIAYILFRTLEAQRQTKALYFINMSYFIIELVLTLILLPTVGLWGAVVAQGVSNVWFLGSSLYFTTKKNKLVQ